MNINSATTAMKTKTRTTVVKLKGHNSGADLKTELKVRSVINELAEGVDHLIQGDNGVCEMPTLKGGTAVYDPYLATPDQDPADGRVLVDHSQGKVKYRDGRSRYRTSPSVATISLSFDPTTKEPLQYSMSNGKYYNDVTFSSGRLKEVVSQSKDGTNKQTWNFSQDGNMVTIVEEFLAAPAS